MKMEIVDALPKKVQHGTVRLIEMKKFLEMKTSFVKTDILWKNAMEYRKTARNGNIDVDVVTIKKVVYFINRKLLAESKERSI